MLILDSCNEPLYNIVIYPLKAIMNLILIIAPILLIISLIIIFTKGLLNPDDKKIPKKIYNAIIALFWVFCVSVVVNVVMAICGSKFNVSDCWNNTKKIKVTITNEYIDAVGENEKKILSTDSTKYQSSKTGDSSTTTGSAEGSTGSEKINNTAKNLAWPLGTSSSVYKSKPTDAYKAANDTYILSRIASSQKKYDYAKGKSCCIFVTAVVRASGYDSSFPYCVDKSRQYANKSSKWKQVSMDDIVAGDIIMYKNNGHILLYGGTATSNGKTVYVWYQANLNKDYGYTFTTNSKTKYKNNSVAYHATG